MSLNCPHGIKNGGCHTCNEAEGFAAEYAARQRKQAITKSSSEVLLDEALTLMKEFCARVERGEVRSRQTYAKFKIFIAQVEDGQL